MRARAAEWRREARRIAPPPVSTEPKRAVDGGDKWWSETVALQNRVAEIEADRARLVQWLAKHGAIDPEIDPIGSAISILDAYTEIGPWPGKPVLVAEVMP
jgi:hypothetical protein